MNTELLYQILSETTVVMRKGDVIKHSQAGSINVTTVDAFPAEHEAADGLEKVDLHYVIVGVDKAKAKQRKQDLIQILDSYPAKEQLAGGPSYISVGAEIGDQTAAFQLFALGKVLGLWNIITPKTFGIKGKDAENMAGSGFIMISGYRSNATAN